MTSHEYVLNMCTYDFSGTLPQVWDVKKKIEKIIPQEVFMKEMACMVKEKLLTPLLEVQSQMWGTHTLVHGPQSCVRIQT